MVPLLREEGRQGGAGGVEVQRVVVVVGSGGCTGW